MLKIIFNRVVKRLFPNRSMQSLTKSEILRAENEAIQIMNRTKGKTGEVIDLTGRRIDTSQPIMGGKNVVEVDKIKLGDLTEKGFTPTVVGSVPNKRAEFLKKYTKDGQPNDVELNALANEHRILSAEAKKLGDAGENYEKFSQLNKRTDEIQEILDFMNKEFPEGMASGGRIGYAQGTKKPGERYYLPTKGKEWLHSMPEIDPYKKFFRRQNKLMKFKDSKGLAEILGV